MSNKIKAVMLDYDMTLIESIYDFYDAYNEALKKFLGKTITFNEFYNLLISHRLGDLIRNVDEVEFWRYHRRRCRSMYGYPVRGAYYFLYWVKNLGLKTVIISGRECHSSVLLYELRKFGLDEYIDNIYTLFDLYVYGGEEEELFDKSWLMRFVLRKYGIENDEAVYLGDYRLDYISSRKVGVEFIGVALSEERRKCLLDIGAKRVARDLYEALLHLIEIMKVKESG